MDFREAIEEAGLAFEISDVIFFFVRESLTLLEYKGGEVFESFLLFIVGDSFIEGVIV